MHFQSWDIYFIIAREDRLLSCYIQSQIVWGFRSSYIWDFLIQQNNHRRKQARLLNFREPDTGKSLWLGKVAKSQSKVTGKKQNPGVWCITNALLTAVYLVKADESSEITWSFYGSFIFTSLLYSPCSLPFISNGSRLFYSEPQTYKTPDESTAKFIQWAWPLLT